jgi:NADPH-dependent curcumin reductase
MPISRRVVLTARPDGIPQAQHFRIETADTPALKSGEILVRNQFLSVEPAMRGWVSAVANYAQPVGIGEVMRSFASGEVMASEHPGFGEPTSRKPK